MPLSWDICEASQLLHLKFNTTSNKENKKIRLKAVSEDLKNIVGLEYLVDCSQTNSDSKQPEGSHDLEVSLDCKKPKKIERRGEMSEQLCTCPVDLTAGCHTMFVFCDLFQNEILGDTQTALLRAVPLGDNKRQPTFSRIQWRRVIKSSVLSLTIALRNEAGGLIPFLSRGSTNLNLHFRQTKQIPKQQPTIFIAFTVVVVVILLSSSVLLSKLCHFPHCLIWKSNEAVVLLVGSFYPSI